MAKDYMGRVGYPYRGGSGGGGRPVGGGARPLTPAQKRRNVAAKTYITKGAKTAAEEMRDAKAAARMKKVWQASKQTKKRQVMTGATGFAGGVGGAAIVDERKKKAQPARGRAAETKRLTRQALSSKGKKK